MTYEIKMMKRKIEDQLEEFEIDETYLSRPAKRISMCYNTPKQVKDEKKKLMKTSKKKLKQMPHPEANLRRSLFVNNIYKRLQSELQQEKSSKYYGYAFNPKCPFGFGAGVKEIALRKKQAKLEQLLSEKKRLYEESIINQIVDPIDGDKDNGFVDIEQLSCKASGLSIQHRLNSREGTSESRVGDINIPTLCKYQISGLTSALCDNSCRDSVCDNDCMADSDGAFVGRADCMFAHNNAGVDKTMFTQKSDSYTTCDALKTEQSMEYDSDNEEIDVCSCDDEIESSENTLASGLLKKQIAETAPCDITLNTESYRSPLNPGHIINCSSPYWPSYSAFNDVSNDFPPKVDLADDKLNQGENELDKIREVNPVVSKDLGSMHSVYQGLIGQSFVHPLFYQGLFQFGAVTNQETVANTFPSYFYNVPQSYLGSYNASHGGDNCQQSKSRFDLMHISNNMVTCT